MVTRKMRFRCLSTRLSGGIRRQSKSSLAVSAGRTQASIGGPSFSSRVARNDAEVLGQPEHQRRTTSVPPLATGNCKRYTLLPIR